MKLISKESLVSFCLVIGISACSITALDYTLVKLNLFSSGRTLGDPKIGFGLEDKGRINISDQTLLNRTPNTNSRGFKTRRAVSEILKNPARIRIAVVGDSHTYLHEDQIPLEKQHPFILEEELQNRGVDAEVFHAGVGRYSPLQEYLLYKFYLKDEFKPNVLIMNIYTGNDFYDLLRPDDRPHFSIGADEKIVIKPPRWTVYKNPDKGSWPEESLVFDLANQLMVKMGQPGILTRLKFLTTVAYNEGESYSKVFPYINDIRLSIEPKLGYSGAFSAQILNQALFMEKYFKGSVQKSKKFYRYLLRQIRLENPELTVIVCAIPSAVLADRLPNKELFLQTLNRISMTYEQVFSLEEDLYEEARDSAQKEGFVFVDVLALINQVEKNIPLYNSRDLHINEKVSEILGKEQAKITQSIM